jgi:hypothetical protein
MPGTKQMKQVQVQTYKGWQVNKVDKIDLYYASKDRHKLGPCTTLLWIRKDIRKQEVNDKWLGYHDFEHWHTLVDLYEEKRDGDDKIWGTAWTYYTALWEYLLMWFIFNCIIPVSKGYTIWNGKIKNGYALSFLGIFIFLWWVLVTPFQILSVLLLAITYLLLIPWLIPVGLWSLLFELPASALGGQFDKDYMPK